MTIVVIDVGQLISLCLSIVQLSSCLDPYFVLFFYFVICRSKTSKWMLKQQNLFIQIESFDIRRKRNTQNGSSLSPFLVLTSGRSQQINVCEFRPSSSGKWGKKREDFNIRMIVYWNRMFTNQDWQKENGNGTKQQQKQKKII